MPLPRLLSLIILVTLALPAVAQKQSSPDGNKPLVYNDTTDSSRAFDRLAKNALAGKFRFIDVTLKDGFTPARVKGFEIDLRDPRSPHDSSIPAKASYAFIVTPDGRVIEPRILSSTDPLVSKYVLNQISYRRYFPARYKGVPVYDLHGDEFKVGGAADRGDRMFRDGLGIMGQRDR